MKTKTSTHKRNLGLLIGVVVLIFTLPSWYVGKEILPNENILDCSLCDVSASGGAVSVQANLDGFTAELSSFCSEAGVSLSVSGAILPNDTYENIFLVTDTAANIVAYASSGSSGVVLIGTFPVGTYIAWHLVYTNTVFPVLPVVGSSAAALIAAGENGTGCMAVSEPIEFMVTDEFEVSVIGFYCLYDADTYNDFIPIIKILGGCAEIVGYGVYNVELEVLGWVNNISGTLEGNYVEGVGITDTLWHNSLINDYSAFLVYVTDSNFMYSATGQAMTDPYLCSEFIEYAGCDATASAGELSIPSDIEGYNQEANAFCADATISLNVLNAILPNDNYLGFIMITDTALNIANLIYTYDAESSTEVFDMLPSGDYTAWQIVYYTGFWPPYTGVNASSFIAIIETGTTCLDISEPLNFSVASEDCL